MCDPRADGTTLTLSMGPVNRAKMLHYFNATITEAGRSKEGPALHFLRFYSREDSMRFYLDNYCLSGSTVEDKKSGSFRIIRMVTYRNSRETGMDLSQQLPR
jgi:hypothetical protein